jgi:tricarballylate dehydrogenase
MGIRWDLVVIGGGNAGLVAALSARHLVSRVLLLERSPIELRGGNTRHARNIRCVHRNPGTYNTDSYLHHEFFRDLRQAGDGSGNEALAALTISESEKVPEWMSAHGIHWQPLIRSERQLGRTNRLLLGGGKALVNAYHGTLASMGIAVLYDALVEDLVIDGDVCTGVVFSVAGIEYNVDTAAVICASGGFEGNDDWLSNYWGDAVANCTIRGSESNDGIVLNTLYAHGAASVGDERCFHAVPVDARSPRFDGGIATRLDTIPFGILVNQAGQRFCDEGDVLPKRYAIWGRRIADQPGQITYSIWDAKVNSLFRPPMYGPFEATSLADLARSLGLNELTLCETVAQYNSSPRSRARFDPIRFDGLATTGLDIPKSNWAQPIDEPPFYGVAMRPGITFISKGVAITEEAKVVRIDGSVFSNIFAAGAIMSGNILPTGFLSGFGLTVGSVWGHIAGTVAAHVET